MITRLNDNLITVIIPTYNDFSNTCRAINSVLSQTYTSFEVIIIDDNHDKSCFQKLTKIYKQENIYILKNTRNLGPGLSRNIGLNKAKGKYIFFLDSDDWIENNTFNDIITIALKDGMDIVEFGINKVEDNSKITTFHSHEFECFDNFELLDRFSNYDVASTIWNKLYLRRFLVKNKIRFKSAYQHQDVIFTLNVLSKCTKYKSISKCYYNYFQRTSSIVHNNLSEKHLDSYIQLFYEFNHFIVSNKLFSNHKDQILSNNLIRAHIISAVIPYIVKYHNSADKDLFEFAINNVCKKYFKKNWLIFSSIILNLAKLQSEQYTNTAMLYETINNHNLKINNLNQKNSIMEKQIIEITSQLSNTSSTLQNIYNSHGWKFLSYTYKLRDKIWQMNHLIKKVIANIFKNSNIDPVQDQTNNIRFINKKSRKIVYIGHSYHAKTKSTDFLLQYLKENFEVTEILDESWKGNDFPDYSFIDNTYLAVIFFQTIPPPSTISQIRNQNIIFFPMYDNHGGAPKEFWDGYKNLKIINFSNTLFQKLKKWGFETIYIQYFPKPLKITESKKHNIFFWQRISSININLIEKLIGNLDTSIHIHKNIDINNTFLQPTAAQESKYGITYSKWLKKREDIQKIIQKCDIFIAPREYEGIGLSFLEAMAMGKAVIAPNNPTMNEYIKDNYNGYLYDIHHPHLIRLDNLDVIRKNTHSYINQGYIKWNNSRHKIIDFIKK